MRRRITLTVVGVVAGALVLASVGTFVLLRLGVRNDTRRELGRQAADIAARLEEVQRPGVLAALGPVLRLEDQRVLCFGTGCRGAQVPPRGIDRDDLPLDRLEGGETVTGVRGSLVYAAAGAPVREDTTFVVVLTRRVDTRLPGGLWFLAAAGLALAVAAVVAGDLARRLTRPLREAEAATHQIAAGDLAARVPVNRDDGEELSALAESINAMAAGLERSRGLERQFLLAVSHDLRTPLTSIRGYAEALAERRAPDTEQAAGIILSEARRLERLVGDLLELAKLDARRFSLDVRATDVDEVVSDTAEGFRPAAEKAAIALEVEPAGQRLLAAADPDRLAQVVANLVENALKYARSGIRLATGTAGGGSVTVSVEDDGPGIGAEDLPRVFEPFYRSSRTPSRDVGSGLGLAIVKELVTAMDGEVRAEAVESGLGGTRVVVALRPWSAAAASGAG